MATWDQFADFVRRTYRVSEDKGNLLVMDFDLGQGRSQQVIVERNETGSSHVWATIASFFADADAVGDLKAVLAHASEYVVGGIVAYGSTLAFRHTVPLANLDADEFTDPLQMVVHTADSLEQEFGQGDRY